MTGLSSHYVRMPPDQSLLWWLPSAVMTAEEERAAVRLGYWLRRAREHRGVTLGSAAVAAGLSANSGSTVSLWESGKRGIKVAQLRRLARLYRVPESLFIDPPMTDDERLSAVLADAEALERTDWAAGPGAGRGGADERDGGRGRHH